MTPSALSAKPIAVILAAGQGRRMGFSKALLEFAEGETFLLHLAGVFASSGCEVLAVTGHEGARVAAAHPALATVENDRWNDGQLSSARVGIARALAAKASVVLVHPVDAPAIGAATVRILLSRCTARRATVPAYLGKAGHPLLLPRACAEKVLSLESAGSLEAALSSIGLDTVPVDDPGVVLNLNTPEDYQRAFGRPPSAHRWAIMRS
ncbi:MAG TPA: nucleotidyltransferase family protein [Myxococcaceae bacterium]|nr:nucleotidyltransferase family protein [Myxococcaceae bacterium]